MGKADGASGEGKRLKPLKMDISLEEALRGAMKVPPPEKEPKAKKPAKEKEEAPPDPPEPATEEEGEADAPERPSSPF